MINMAQFAKDKIKKILSTFLPEQLNYSQTTFLQALWNLPQNVGVKPMLEMSAPWRWVNVVWCGVELSTCWGSRGWWEQSLRRGTGWCCPWCGPGRSASHTAAAGSAGTAAPPATIQVPLLDINHPESHLDWRPRAGVKRVQNEWIKIIVFIDIFLQALVFCVNSLQFV